MVDLYGIILAAATQPDITIEQIAQATGWPLDAVQTMLEELNYHKQEIPR